MPGRAELWNCGTGIKTTNSYLSWDKSEVCVRMCVFACVCACTFQWGETNRYISISSIFLWNFVCCVVFMHTVYLRKAIALITNQNWELTGLKQWILYSLVYGKGLCCLPGLRPVETRSSSQSIPGFPGVEQKMKKERWLSWGMLHTSTREAGCFRSLHHFYLET